HDAGGGSEPEHDAGRREAYRILSDIVSELRAEYCASNADDDAALRCFEALKPFLVMKLTEAQCAVIARDLGIEPNTAKQRLRRLKLRFAKRFQSSVIVQYGFDDLQESLNAWCAAARGDPPDPAA
ncbi:MAG TPA: hypothetical protein VGK73_15235, partial [Polyangiaceae bacterium]